jgi:cytochrome oxidase Cu insertion factor (SCO1/SenC/PrrC family)
MRYAILLAVSVLLFPTSSLGGAPADPLATMGVVLTERGTEPPDLSLPDPDGKRMGLPDFRGKVVLLTFFTTW